MRTQKEIEDEVRIPYAEAMVDSWKRRYNELAKDMKNQKVRTIERTLFRLQVNRLAEVIGDYERVYGKSDRVKMESIGKL